MSYERYRHEKRVRRLMSKWQFLLRTRDPAEQYRTVTRTEFRFWLLPDEWAGIHNIFYRVNRTIFYISTVFFKSSKTIKLNVLLQLESKVINYGNRFFFKSRQIQSMDLLIDKHNFYQLYSVIIRLRDYCRQLPAFARGNSNEFFTWSVFYTCRPPGNLFHVTDTLPDVINLHSADLLRRVLRRVIAVAAGDLSENHYRGARRNGRPEIIPRYARSDIRYVCDGSSVLLCLCGKDGRFWAIRDRKSSPPTSRQHASPCLRRLLYTYIRVHLSRAHRV